LFEIIYIEFTMLKMQTGNVLKDTFVLFLSDMQYPKPKQDVRITQA